MSAIDIRGRQMTRSHERIHPRWRAGGLLVGLTLTLIAGALSGCASLAVHATLGPAPRAERPQVVEYAWAGRRGDEVIVVYQVWGSRPSRVESRWTAIDLRAVTWSPGLEAPRVGTLDPQPGPVPDPGSVGPVQITTLLEGRPGEGPRAPEQRPPAGVADVAVYTRGGTSPELILVVTDPTGSMRSASWALSVGDPREAAEPLPRALARLVAVPLAGAVDLATAPLQLVLGLLGVVRLH